AARMAAWDAVNCSCGIATPPHAVTTNALPSNPNSACFMRPRCTSSKEWVTKTPDRRTTGSAVPISVKMRSPFKRLREQRAAADAKFRKTTLSPGFRGALAPRGFASRTAAPAARKGGLAFGELGFALRLGATRHSESLE